MMGYLSRAWSQQLSTACLDFHILVSFQSSKRNDFYLSRIYPIDVTSSVFIIVTECWASWIFLLRKAWVEWTRSAFEIIEVTSYWHGFSIVWKVNKCRLSRFNLGIGMKRNPCFDGIVKRESKVIVFWLDFWMYIWYRMDASMFWSSEGIWHDRKTVLLC